MTQFFEDLDEGAVYECGSASVTEEEIIAFARQFDPQPFHLDLEAAESSIFDGLVASGLHTLCIANRLTVDEFMAPLANLGGIGMDDTRWPNPLRPGDELSLEVHIGEKQLSKTRPDRGYVTYTQVATNQDGEELLRASYSVIIERRPQETP